MWEKESSVWRPIQPENLWERAVRQQELAEERNFQREIRLETDEWAR